MVIIADSSCSDINDMFNDKAWQSAKYFNADEYDQAVNYAYNTIKKTFSEYFKDEYNNKFKMYKCLNDLQQIAADPTNLESEEYFYLVLYEDYDRMYFCDLVLQNGKLGLQYARYIDENHEDIDFLDFEEWKPDLKDSISLMVGMQKKLNSFIEKRLDSDINIHINI